MRIVWDIDSKTQVGVGSAGPYSVRVKHADGSLIENPGLPAGGRIDVLVTWRDFNEDEALYLEGDIDHIEDMAQQILNSVQGIRQFWRERGMIAPKEPNHA